MVLIALITVISEAQPGPEKIYLLSDVGMCADLFEGKREPGNKIVVWPCHNGENQQFLHNTSNGELRVFDLCLEDGPGGINASSCNGGPGQKWRVEGDKIRGGVGGNKCFDVAKANVGKIGGRAAHVVNVATRPLARLIAFECHGGVNQRWALIPASAVNAPGRYVIRFDSFDIEETRSLIDDTLHVKAWAKVGDHAIFTPVQHLGDKGNGSRVVLNLEVGPIDVKQAETPVTFGFEIINSGHKSNEAIEKSMNEAGEALTDMKVIKEALEKVPYVGTIASFVMPLLAADCDGVVAIDDIPLSAGTLNAMTFRGRHFAQARFYPGQESPTGCGDNSKYTVGYSVMKR
jgi:hypothetical protein